MALQDVDPGDPGAFILREARQVHLRQVLPENRQETLLVEVRDAVNGHLGAGDEHLVVPRPDRVRLCCCYHVVQAEVEGEVTRGEARLDGGAWLGEVAVAVVFF